ncbi:MAG: M23 family metallopeptidase [Dehalobacterium sp.]
MFRIIKKVQEWEINKTWFIITALFVLTIAATVFFVFQNQNDNQLGEEQPVNQIQVLPVDKEVDNQITEASAGIRKDSIKIPPNQEDAPADQSISESQDVVMRWPGHGELITSYGFIHSETFNDIRFHTGIDIALPPGYEVRSALPGTVISISSSPLWGYEVVIKHGEKLETRYKGIKPLKEKAGYTVAKGDIIGQVMTSPPYEAKMNPHLHFEIYEYGKSVDPMKHLQ